MSIANNNIRREIAPISVIADALPFLSSAVNINQGDLVALNTSTHLLSPLTSVATLSASLLGVMPVTIVAGKLQSSYQGTAVDASQSAVSVSGPIAGVVAAFTLHTGDSLSPGQLVYQDAANTADPQTVTSTQPTGGVAIGIYQGPAISSAAAGTLVEVAVGHSYPGSTLVI